MPFFLTLALWAATFILSELLRPKPKNESARPADLGDFNFPTAAEDRVQPIIWGTVKLEGPNIVWYGDLTQQAITEKVKTGIFSSDTITKGYRYLIGIQFAWCRGPVDEIRRLWNGDEVVSTTILTAEGNITINEPNLYGGDSLGQGGLVGTMSWRPGTTTQVALPYLQNHTTEGGDTPAYRGTAYSTYEHGLIGNSTSVKPWAAELRRIPAGLGGAGKKPVNGGNDANPAYVMTEIMTDPEYDQSVNEADIDVAAFNAAADIFVTEGNGFSFVITSPTELADVLEELQRQTDSVVFLDQSTGLWTIKLARDDYNPATLTVLDESNVLEVRDTVEGLWEDTQNYLTAHFSDRAKDYKNTYAEAQNMATIRIVGRVVKSNQNWPGVKDGDLANQIVWREVRSASIPRTKATLIVDRSFWNTKPTDVFKWSNTALGFTDRIMRVSRVNLGTLDDGGIELNVVDDAFAFRVGSFAAPPTTGWTAPTTALVAIPAAQSIIMEAPKGISERDPDSLSNGLPFRVWVGGRNQADGSVEMDLRTRLSGSFVTERLINQFFLIGQVTSNTGPEIIDSVLTITPTPDSQTNILTQISDIIPSDVNGENLTYLLLINNEFMLVSSAVVNATNVDLQTVYRGVLDSVPASHLAGDSVYLLFVGGGIGNRSFANTNVVDVRLVPRGVGDELAEASTTNVQVTMANRHLKPYPPVGVNLNSVGFYTSSTIDLSDNGSLDTSNIDVDFRRRDLDVLQENLAHISGDAAPSNATTVYRIRVFDTSSGDTLLFVTAYNSGGAMVVVDRTTILHNTIGIIPSSLRVEIETKHTISSVDYTAGQSTKHEFNTEDTELVGDFFFGVLADSVASASYTAPDTGNYAFTIGTDKTGGTVEARINGGSWVEIIASGTATTGTLTGVTATDTIEVRHISLTSSSRTETMLKVDSPVSAVDAFAICEI